MTSSRLRPSGCAAAVKFAKGEQIKTCLALLATLVQCPSREEVLAWLDNVNVDDVMYAVTPATSDDRLLDSVRECLQATRGWYPVDLVQLYSFDTTTSTDSAGRRLLWHGTHPRNLRAILSEGLQPNRSNGLRRAVYFSDSVMTLLASETWAWVAAPPANACCCSVK